MANFETALLNFGHLIGLFRDDGTVDWTWFYQPDNHTLSHMQSNRQYLGKVIRALLGVSEPEDGKDPEFKTDCSWQPFNPNDPVAVGFVWNKQGSPDLQMGFGARAANNQPFLIALANILKVRNSGVASDFGKIFASVPAPDFLDSISFDVDLTGPKFSAAVEDKNSNQRTLASDKPAAVLPWDCARIALFILEAWIHTQAQAGGVDNFFTRSDNHLFRMFGEPAGQIQPFPLFGSANMGTVPNFEAWRNSVVTTQGDGAGALMFLWHLRALLTGNESPNFVNGSLMMPLVANAGPGRPPVRATDAVPATGFPALTTTAGAWIGITDTGGAFQLVILLSDGLGGTCTIPLAEVSGGVFSRPKITTAFNGIKSVLQKMPKPLQVAPGYQVTAQSAGSDSWKVTIFAPSPPSVSGMADFDGPYSVDLTISSAQPVSILLNLSPSLSIDFPPEVDPPSVTTLLLAMVKAILSATVPSDASAKLKAVVVAIRDLLTNITEKSKPDPVELLKAIGAASVSATRIGTSDVWVDLDFAKMEIAPNLSIGPIDQDIAGLALHIGAISASAGVMLNGNQPLQSARLGFTDLRIGSGSSDAFSGFIGTLIPDLKKAPGFLLSVEWTPKGINLTGGGKIPVQSTIGPLSVGNLVVDVRKKSLSILIDLTFQLAVITVAPYELGVQVDFKTGDFTPFLHGLGLSFNGSGITLAGMFAKTDADDYVGGAVVSVLDMFQLSAIGGYKQMTDGTTSLFIFASLVAPLGGTPFMFITGIAGGFGYNRLLPDPQLMDQHPFIKIMNGQVDISGSTAQALDKLGNQFLAKKGDYWIAAGLAFISFGFINGKVIVAVAFGHDFSFNLLGIASFGISPIAYFEIAILITVDSEKFLLKAGVSPASYLISPDIFSLHGDFALGVWHGGPHAGDFLLSIGGYHPCFTKPSYYPEMNRVGVTATVFGFVHVSINCFFACTPQALMAGAYVSLWASFAGISAGLDVYVDVFIKWDPFFIHARLGITVWFEFLGRHEIGVDLQIWTPPFGGLAHISLFIVSFDVGFGTPLNLNDHHTPKLAQFVADKLSIPANEAGSTGDSAKVALFSTDDKPGLISVSFPSGGTPDENQTKNTKQAGIDKPVQVASEFSFRVKTHLPLSKDAAGSNVMTGEVNLPLCGKSKLSSTLTVSGPAIKDAKMVPGTAMFAVANFGDYVIPDAQADDDARSAVANVSAQSPTVELLDSITFHYAADSFPKNPADLTFDGFDFDHDFPLPLAISKQPVTRIPMGRRTFTAGATLRLAPRLIPKVRVAKVIVKATPAPLHVSSRIADLQRPVRVAVAGSSVANPPTGVPVMAPPASPARRPELWAVSLRVLPPHVAHAQTTPHLLNFRPAVNLLRADLTPAAGVTAGLRVPITVASGKAVRVSIAGGAIPGASLTLAGQQTVRTIFLTSMDEPLADLRAGGNATLAAPLRARRMVMIGEGNSPTTLDGAVGIEAKTVVLALGPQTFAGHGCVVLSNTSLPMMISALDSMPGSELFENLSNFRTYFNAATKGSCLVMTLSPTTANPGAAPDQVRWRTDAMLSGLVTVIAPDRAAFVMTVDAPADWVFDVELASDWRMTSLIVSPRTSADLTEYLRTHADWNMVDDRLSLPATPVDTIVNLEIANA